MDNQKNKNSTGERRLVSYPKQKYVRFVIADAANEATSQAYIIAKIIEKHYDSLSTSEIDKLKSTYNHLDANEK
jgi:hypothetical protein